MKYRFEGIGEKSAIVAMAALASSPLAWFTVGVQGKITFFILKMVFMGAASIGLVVLNVGIAKVETMIEKNGFDGSWESAEKLIREIKEQGRELTDEEKKRIDDPVRAAFRKFARFGRMRNGRNTGAKAPDRTSGKR